MADVVQIQIRIDDGDSVATVRRVEQAVTGLGTQGAPAVAKVGTELQQLGGHSTTSLDQIRLLSQEFGLRLPRAMEAALSRMPALTAAVGSFSGVLLGIGAAEVFVHMGEGIYNAEQKYISITAAADKFYESLKKSAELDFTNTHSLATTQARLDQAQVQGRTAPAQAKALSNEGWKTLIGGLVNPGSLAAGAAEIGAARDTAEKGVAAQGNTISLSEQQVAQQHELTLQHIATAHARDINLSKAKQLLAVDQKEHELATENADFAYKQEVAKGNLAIKPTKENPSPEQASANAAADAEARAKNIDLQAQMSVASIKAQNAEREAGLQGEALYRQKERDTERELAAELHASHEDEEISTRLAQQRAQFRGEELARVRELTEQTRKQTQEASLAGKTGAARILGERDNKLADIDQAQNLATVNGQIDPQALQAFNQQRVNAANEATAKIQELEDRLTEHVKESVAQRTESELGGYDRIAAAAARERMGLQKQYDDIVNDARVSSPQREAAAKELATGLAAIDSDEASKKSQLTERNAAEDLASAHETAQAESRVRAQGLMGWVSSYRDAVAAIREMEEQRKAKLLVDAHNEGLTAEEVARRRADVERTANAEIAQQNQELQHTIAGNLQQAFTDPVDFIKRRMEQMMFEIIAGWVMRLQVFKNLFGDTLGNVQAPGSAAHGAGGIMSSIMTGRAPTGTAGWAGATAGAGGSTMGGWSTTAASAATPNAGGGSSTLSSILPQLTGGGAPGSTGASMPGGFSLSPAQITGNVATPTFGGGADNGYNGEDGGFAGYITGDTDPLSARTLDPDSVSGVASTQATANNAAGVAGGGSAALGLLGAAGAAYAGGKGVYDSFFQTGAKGAVDGAVSGLEAGAAIGSIAGPLGTVIGAGVGAAVGLATTLVGQITGEGPRIQARDYYRNTLFPQLEGVIHDYGYSDGGDYLSAVSKANSTAAAGYDYMSQKYGASAATWVKNNYLDKERLKVTTEIVQEAGAGKQYMQRAAAQFHTGGVITGFGDLATSSNEGFIHAMRDETVIQPIPSQSHAPFLHAINDGADAVTMAGMYLNAAGAGSPGRGSGGDTHHWSISSLDSADFAHYLRHRGGMDAIAKESNRRTANYSGDGNV